MITRNTWISHQHCDKCAEEIRDSDEWTPETPTERPVLCLTFAADCGGDVAYLCERHILAAFAEAKEANL